MFDFLLCVAYIPDDVVRLHPTLSWLGIQRCETVYAEIVEAIRRHRLFILTTHVHPDGDGLGCEIALQAFLGALGKEAHIINNGPLPKRYAFIAPLGAVQSYAPDVHDPLIARADAIFVLDISTWERLGPMREPISAAPAFKICIDHHPYRENATDIALVDENASSTAEILWGLILAMDGQWMTSPMAEALYMAILTDTGSFRFPNSTPKTLRVAAALMEAGAMPSQISQKLYEQYSWERMKLLGQGLLTSQVTEDRRIAWMEITLKDQERFSVLNNEVEGFLDVLRAIKEVQIAALFIENAEGEIKVSLRSKVAQDVHIVARKLGGGGHPKAAGCVVHAGMAEAVSRVLGELRCLVS